MRQPVRKPPTCLPHLDPLAQQCGVQTVSFSSAVPPLTLCHYCGGWATTRDHIVPDSVAGSKYWWNLVPSCELCNLVKADRQSCSCLFCLRAMALWSLGFRREGRSYGDKRRRKAANAAQSKPLGYGLSPEQIATLSALTLPEERTA